MSYKEKLNASQAEAHNQNIATKILRDLTKLRATIEEDTSNSRRWIWELVQNAKDVARKGGVTIQIIKKKSGDFWFCHDGRPFKADNIRYLVEQISTKDQEEENDNGKRKTTGKFGTGFLTTHLLSERVTVHGVLKELDEAYKKFNVELDRSGFTNGEIIESVKKSRSVLNEVDDLPDLDDYSSENMNTRFQYFIADDIGLKIMKEGMKDLKANIGYALSISDQIKEIRLGTKGCRTYKSEIVTTLNEHGEIVEIITEDGGESTSQYFAVLKLNFTSIVVPVEVVGDYIGILEIDDSVPSLFCEFPLIGSSSFSFPSIINNPNFNPTEPRDGIQLTTTQRVNILSDQNKEYISEALELYEVFVEHATTQNWGNLHLLARINDNVPQASWLNKHYFDNNVVSGVRKIIRKKSIVTSSKNNLIPLFDQRNTPHTLIPRIGKNSLREKLWEKGITIFPKRLPSKEQIPFWAKYAWNACDKFNSITVCKFIEQATTIEVLTQSVTSDNIFEWLDSLYLVLEEDEYNYDRLINQYKMFPNQNGHFVKWGEVEIQEGEINETFKKILIELGEDICHDLLDTRIDFRAYDRTKVEESDVIRSINRIVPEKANDRENAKRYRPAFNLLLLYFREDEKGARKKFTTLYKNKYLLFDEDEMIANVERVEEINDLLKEFDLEDISDIKKVLAERSSMEENSRELLPITSEIISSLGITNIEDWKEAMKDVNLAAMFDHTSVTSTDMFIAAATYIEKANMSIVNHLDILERYDIDEHFFTANTILSGVRKDGRPIEIVCRPAYKNEVIIYYETERAVLDYEEGELWIDSSKGVEKITLGRILKKAKIQKFPV
jgi:hypothetical protein